MFLQYSRHMAHVERKWCLVMLHNTFDHLPVNSKFNSSLPFGSSINESVKTISEVEITFNSIYCCNGRSCRARHNGMLYITLHCFIIVFIHFEITPPVGRKPSGTSIPKYIYIYI